MVAPIARAPDIRGSIGRSMPEDLAETLRSQIRGGLLGPGDRLPNERDLAASLGIGRITVRRAIQQLVSEGFLFSKRGNSGGTFVSDLEAPRQAWVERVRRAPEWVVDLIEYRKAVEMRAAELAARRRSAGQVAQMRAAIEEGSAPTSRRSFRQADHHFHVAVAEASSSPRLVDAIVQARGELFLPTDQLVFEDRFAQTADEHSAILAAIDAGDPEAARAAAETHLQASLQDFLDLIVGG